MPVSRANIEIPQLRSLSSEDEAKLIYSLWHEYGSDFGEYDSFDVPGTPFLLSAYMSDAYPSFAIVLVALDTRSDACRCATEEFETDFWNNSIRCKQEYYGFLTYKVLRRYLMEIEQNDDKMGRSIFSAATSRLLGDLFNPAFGLAEIVRL